MMSLYMGMKRLPNMKSFWTKSKKILYYSIILGLFSRQRFFALLRCLHIINSATYTIDKNNLEYDKMH